MNKTHLFHQLHLISHLMLSLFVGSLYVATGNFDLAVAGSARPWPIPMPLEYAIHAVHNNNNDLEITIS